MCTFKSPGLYKFELQHYQLLLCINDVHEKLKMNSVKGGDYIPWNIQYTLKKLYRIMSLLYQVNHIAIIISPHFRWNVLSLCYRIKFLKIHAYVLRQCFVNIVGTPTVYLHFNFDFFTAQTYNILNHMVWCLKSFLIKFIRF